MKKSETTSEIQPTDFRHSQLPKCNAWSSRPNVTFESRAIVPDVSLWSIIHTLLLKERDRGCTHRHAKMTDVRRWTPAVITFLQVSHRSHDLWSRIIARPATQIQLCTMRPVRVRKLTLGIFSAVSPARIRVYLRDYTHHCIRAHVERPCLLLDMTVHDAFFRTIIACGLATVVTVQTFSNNAYPMVTRHVRRNVGGHAVALFTHRPMLMKPVGRSFVGHRSCPSNFW